MASLMPLQKSVLPWKVGHGGAPVGHCPPIPPHPLTPQPLSQMPPQVGPFRQDHFLRSLEQSGTRLSCVLRGDWRGLYRWVMGRGAREGRLAQRDLLPAAAPVPQALLQVPPL